MADIRKNRNYKTAYINDNLARKQAAYSEALPKRREEVRQQPEHRVSHNTQNDKNRGLSSSFGFAFTSDCTRQICLSSFLGFLIKVKS